VSGGVASLFKKSLGYGLAQLSGPVLQYLLVPVYSRLLKLDDYGLVFLMVSVAGVFELLCRFSINVPMVRLSHEQQDEQTRRRFYATFTWLQVGFIALLMLIVLAFAQPLNALIGNTDKYLGFFVLSIVAGGMRAMVNLPANLFRIQENVRAYLALMGSFNLVQKGCTVLALLLFKSGLVAYFWSITLTSALYFLIGLYIMVRASGFYFNWALALSSFSLSAPLAVNQLLNWVMNLSDRAILNRHFDHATVAIYSMGYQFGFMLTYVDLAFFTAWSPMFYKRSVTVGDGPELVTKFAPYLFVIACSVAAVLAGCSRELILVFSTPEYLPSRQVILIVAAGYAISELFNFVGPIAVQQRRASRITYISLLSACVNLGLNLWLIPVYGYLAAAWNTVAALGVGTLAGYLITRASFPLRLPWLKIGRAALATVAAGTCGWFMTFDPAWLALLVKLLLLPASIAGLLFVSGFFSSAEKHAIALRLGRLAGRLRGSES